MPGSKQTEVGILPDEWDVVTLDGAAGIIDPQPDHRTPPECAGGDPYIGISDFIDDRTVDWDGSRKIVPTAVDKQRDRFQVRNGDIIFGKIGTIGRPKFVPDPSTRYGLSANVLLLQPRGAPYFLMAWLRCDAFQRAVNAELHSTSQAAFGINKMRRMLIAAPPEPEQRAIAAALSDVDSLLDALDRLIAKKRDLKQAAMQQLLTGQTRLPGFTGKWETRTLEEATVCLDNLRVPLNEEQRARSRGDYPYCGANGILDFVDGYVVDDDIILMAEDGGYFDEYKRRPIAYRMKGKCWVNNHAHILKARDGNDQAFVYYSLVHKNILRFLASGTRAKLNKSEMNKIEIDVPKSVEEQAAIGGLLSDMDAELAALKQRRDKTRLLKQGMMQELLTGRTRLV